MILCCALFISYTGTGLFLQQCPFRLILAGGVVNCAINAVCVGMSMHVPIQGGEGLCVLFTNTD